MEDLIMLVIGPKHTLLGFTLEFGIWLAIFTLGFVIRFNSKSREVWFAAIFFGAVVTLGKTAIIYLPNQGDLIAAPATLAWVFLSLAGLDYVTKVTQAKLEKRGVNATLIA
jgi:hypothetical protein